MLNMMTQVIAIFIFEMSFCLFILNSSVLEQLKTGTLPVPGLELAFARFITGIAMHVQMTTRMRSGMDKMKYALNHQWKFNRWRWAYMAGLCQVITNAFVAIISYFVITFDETVTDAVMDFLALQVISDLAKHFFVEYMKSAELCKRIVLEDCYNGLCEIQTTTSSKARVNPRVDHEDLF